MRKFLLFSLIFSVLFGSLEVRAQRGNGKSPVMGRVVDEKNKPVQGVTVYFEKTGLSAETNADGSYRFYAAPGNYTIVFRHIGFSDNKSKVTVASGETLYKNVTLKENAKTISEVVVMGRSSVQEINESAYNVVAIDAHQLYNTTLDVSKALDRVSGVKIRESGGMGSASTVYLNGFTGRHVKMFMDGVPMEGSGSAFSINNIPVNIADRIEIYKGVVPIEFGTDAIGGAINIVTKRTTNTFVDASYSYGSFNTHKSNISFGHTTKGGFHINLNAYQNYSDNDYKVYTAYYDASNVLQDAKWFRRFHDQYHNEAVIAKIGIVNKKWADRLLVGVNVNNMKDEIQNANIMRIVYGGRVRKAQGFSPSLTYENRDMFTRGLNFSLNAVYNKTNNKNIDTMARRYVWDGSYTTKSSKGEGSSSLAKYKRYNHNVTANLNYRFGEHHYIAVNNIFSTFKRKASDSASASDGTVNEATLMKRENRKNVLGAVYRFDMDEKWNVSAFGKYYSLHITGPMDVSTNSSTTSYALRSKDYDKIGYGLAATYRLNLDFQVKMSYEQTYRLPTENELFGDTVLESGDASLKPENSKNYNLNLSYSTIFNKQHSIYVDLGGYYRDTRDYIRRKIDEAKGGASYLNHGKIRTMGLDVELRYFFRRNVSVGGNFTWLNARNKNKGAAGTNDAAIYNNRTPNVPYRFGGLDASYSAFNLMGKGSVLTVGYHVNYVHSYYRSWSGEGGSSRIIIPQQTTHDLNLTTTFKDGRYNIAFEARNIADKMVFDNYSLQKPGRSFSVKFRYFFMTSK